MLYGFARIYRIYVYLSLRTLWTLRTYRLGTTLLLIPEVRRGFRAQKHRKCKNNGKMKVS